MYSVKLRLSKHCSAESGSFSLTCMSLSLTEDHEVTGLGDMS
jgi:hypothetical protein